MDKYVSARYLDEKLAPIRNLIKIVDEAESNDIGKEIYNPEEIAFSMAVIAKELGVKIPEV